MRPRDQGEVRPRPLARTAASRAVPSSISAVDEDSPLIRPDALQRRHARLRYRAGGWGGRVAGSSCWPATEAAAPRDGD